MGKKNYKISVEALDGAPSVIPNAWEKKKCEGFCLLTYDGESWDYIVENVSRIELAHGLVQSPVVAEASLIAQGLISATEYHFRRREAELKNILKGAGK